MFGYGALRAPDQIVDRYPGFQVDGVAAGTGDNTEVASQGVSVLGSNAGSASAHGVVGVQYEALEAEFAILATLGAADTLKLKGPVIEPKIQ